MNNQFADKFADKKSGGGGGSGGGGNEQSKKEQKERVPDILEDYLDEDDPISGQKYALISFISPENVLERKDLFFFEKFLEDYELEWKTKNLEKFIANTVISINNELIENAVKLEQAGNSDGADICRKNTLKIGPIMEKYHEYVAQNQKENATGAKIKDAWEDFLFKNQTKLEDEFHAKNEFRTTMRGFKVRGFGKDETDAQRLAKRLQNKDRYHNIYCAEVGKWTPWDPKSHQVQEQEYAEEQLNKLMKNYKENEDNKTKFFDEQREEQRKKASENKKQGQPAITIERVDAGAGAGAGASADAGAGAGALPTDLTNALFEGAPDLALQRKMNL
jgi:hypothetical protein